MNTDKQKITREKYRKKYPDRVKESQRKTREKYPDRTNEYHQKNIRSWEGYISKKTKCQICGKIIYFNKRNQKQAIHWDHRRGGKEKIKGNPTAWLMSHEKTERNKKLWESCGFGMLCGVCNHSLPTKNRVKFYINLGKYILGGE